MAGYPAPVAVHALDNASWGFESSCFVCEPSNPGGLRIPFHYDDEARVVFAEFELEATFSGAPSYVHGGVTMAVLDEAMAWATIAVARSFALTVRSTTEFHRAVRVGRRYRVEARVLGRTDHTIEAQATVSDDAGRPCAEATATFRPMGADQARAAMGVEVTGADAAFLRE